MRFANFSEVKASVVGSLERGASVLKLVGKVVALLTTDGLKDLFEDRVRRKGIGSLDEDAVGTTHEVPRGRNCRS